MLVGERRNGNLLVQLAPKLHAQPEELLRQRWSVDGHVEYLIRWAVHSTEESGGGSSGATSQAENKSSNILMWMSAEEVYSNCPTLLGKRKPEGPGVPEEKSPGPPDEGALHEMSEDVRMLVQRATRQMSHSCGPDSSILNTIHVLSAYASIGSLAGVFKETGALDLLMKMLCNPEKQIRKNAGKMLRALASHDAGSRAHVLLSLSQQDGIEQHMDFESRFTLLQLFAETTSSEEHCISFDGIHLPQIPGKQLFSLVKRYLCVTSLLDQLSCDRPDCEDTGRLQRQFDFCMAMGRLICELVRVMGWVSERPQRTQMEQDLEQHRVFRSIFQPLALPCPSLQVSVHPPVRCTSAKKLSKEFMTPSDFISRNAYVDYIQEALKPGMVVRMLEDYDEISAGDEGVFRLSNNGMPPVQVLKAIPTGQFLRARRICSTDVLFEKQSKVLEQRFSDRRYNKGLIRKGYIRAKNTPRDQLLKSTVKKKDDQITAQVTICEGWKFQAARRREQSSKNNNTMCPGYLCSN